MMMQSKRFANKALYAKRLRKMTKRFFSKIGNANHMTDLGKKLYSLHEKPTFHLVRNRKFPTLAL